MSKMRVQDADDSDSDNIPDGPGHFKMLVGLKVLIDLTVSAIVIITISSYWIKRNP